jgi:hypothetical protein
MKITLATTCMERMQHLADTFLANIRMNWRRPGGPDVDFVLLNYGASQALDAWARDALGGYIDLSVVTYASAESPSGKWHANHARNVAALLSTGDVVVNVDADNLTAPGFAAHVADSIGRPGERFMWPGPCARRKDCAGRLAFHKSDLLRLRGYDEQMRGWGYTDADLRDRAIAAGLEGWHYDEDKVGTAIAHDDRMRTCLLAEQNVSVSWRANRDRSQRRIRQGMVIANEDRSWGEATVVVNFVQLRKVGQW